MDENKNPQTQPEAAQDPGKPLSEKRKAALLRYMTILFSAAFGVQRTQRFMNRRTYSVVRTFGLMLYAVLYGIYIFIGANGLPNHLAGMILLIDLAVGLVVACTMYGFYALFSRGEI